MNVTLASSKLNTCSDELKRFDLTLTSNNKNAAWESGREKMMKYLCPNAVTGSAWLQSWAMLASVHLIVGGFCTIAHADDSKAEEFDRFGETLTSGDFDGDGDADLAVGLPGEAVGTEGEAGMVEIFNGGSSSPLQFAKAIVQNDLGSQVSEEGDNFGYAMAVGDFNGDGFADLAIGVSGEQITTNTNAGMVQVLYGNASGLNAAGGRPSQAWTEDSSGVPGAVFTGDRFGAALAAGDFNADDVDDLAIGAPGDSAGGHAGAGVVIVLLGVQGTSPTTGGLTATGAQMWSQDTTGIQGSPEDGDAFGSRLVAANFGYDSADDLAIGVPNEAVGSATKAGCVNIIFGSSLGLSSANNQLWDQDSTGVPDSAETNDGFGDALAAGRFNSDGYRELAIGVPGERNSAGDTFAGAVNVMYGSATGFGSSQQFWSQDSSGILGVSELGDLFGSALWAGDFNDDGIADVAIGVVHETGAFSFTGAVNVIYGSSSGLTSTGNQVWDEDSSGVHGTAENADTFGAAVSVGDYNNDGIHDLAIGIPNKTVSGLDAAGMVDVLVGTTSGLSAGSGLFVTEPLP